MSSPPDPASHQRGEHLLGSAGQLPQRHYMMDLALQAHPSLHREVGEEAEVEASAVGDVIRSLLEEFHSGHWGTVSIVRQPIKSDA